MEYCKELILIIVKYAVPGIIGIGGVWIGFRMNRKYQERTLNRQSLKTIRPTIIRLIKLCLDIQIYYKLEEATDFDISEVRIRLSTKSINENFSQLTNEFEVKTYEILDVVNSDTKKLLGLVLISCMAVQTYLPTKPAHPDFYNQGKPNEFLQNEVRRLLEVLGSI